MNSRISSWNSHLAVPPAARLPSNARPGNVVRDQNPLSHIFKHVQSSSNVCLCLLHTFATWSSQGPSQHVILHYWLHDTAALWDPRKCKRWPSVNETRWRNCYAATEHSELAHSRVQAWLQHLSEAWLIPSALTPKWRANQHLSVRIRMDSHCCFRQPLAIRRVRLFLCMCRTDQRS